MAVNKPDNYDQTQAAGDFVPIELGGHDLVIKQVEEMVSKTGKQMLKVSFDTADNDKQPHYFADQFRNDIRPDKKWPSNGASYIRTEDEDGKCSRNFKTFTTSVEKSNPGFVVRWGDEFCQCFKNKHIGGIFGIEKDWYNDKEVNHRKLRWFRSVEKALAAEIPAETETQAYKQKNALSGLDGKETGFMNIPDGIDEELPFN